MKMYEVIEKKTGRKNIMDEKMAACFMNLLCQTGRIDECEFREIEC